MCRKGYSIYFSKWSLRFKKANDKLQCHYYKKAKHKTTDVAPMTCPFLWTTNICTGLIYIKCNKIMSHRHLQKVTYTKSTITNTISNITYILCHVHVINIITSSNHVTYYDMYKTSTLICLQHCLHYAPCNRAATIMG